MSAVDKGILLKGIRKVAEHYNCGVESIQKLVNESAIPCYRIGRSWYFYSGEIDEALKVGREVNDDND